MRRISVAIIFVFVLAATPAFSGNFQLQENIRISCFTLKGIESRLNHVVNEMQVYNNDPATWHNRDGCAIIKGRPFTTNREEARRAGVFNPEGIGGFVGWLVTNDWLVPVEHFAYTDKSKDEAWRPADILSRDRYTLPRRCFERRIKMFGVEIVGHQLSAGNIWDERLKRLCSRPIIKSRERPERRYERQR